MKAQPYTGPFYVRGQYNGTFKASLESMVTSDILGTVDIPSRSTNNEWTRHDFVITPTKMAETFNNTFLIRFDSVSMIIASISIELTRDRKMLRGL